MNLHVTKDLCTERYPVLDSRGHNEGAAACATYVHNIHAEVLIRNMVACACMPAGVWRLALAGGVAGCCFWTAIFPTDVVKSRIQVRLCDFVGLRPSKQLVVVQSNWHVMFVIHIWQCMLQVRGELSGSFWTTLFQIYRNEGR